MKTIVKLLAVLTLVLAGFSQHSTALAATNFKFKGNTADAFFSSFDGCVLTEVSIFASEGVFKSGPGRGGLSSGTSLFISQFDFCADTQVLAAEGFAELSPSDFEVANRLSMATLDATVNVFDFVSGLSFDVDVDLTWTATGLSRQNVNNHFTSPGCKVHSRFRGTSREATVSGSISDGNANFTPEAGLFGLISAVKQGDVVIGCNG
jgi:hypothetical protein